MSEVSGITHNSIDQLGVDQLKRYKPEPKNSLAAGFANVMQTIGKTAASTLGFGPSLVSGADSGYGDLLNKQIEMQQQMQVVSMSSNIEKSKHETQMAAIRNIRVG